MNRRCRVLAPGLGPFHGRTEPHREMAAKRFFGVHVQLRAEAPTHFGRDDSQLVLGHANHARQKRPQVMRHLRRRPDGHRAFTCVVRRDHGSRLDGHRGEPLVVDTLFDHAVGLPEGLVDITAAVDVVRERDVRPEVRVRQRRAGLERLFRVDDDRQWVVAHIYGFGAVASRVSVGRDDHDHRVTDEVHAFSSKHGVLRQLQIRNRCRAGHDAALFVDVGAGEDGNDALGGFCRFCVDAGNPRMRVRAPHERHVQKPRQPHIVRVGADAFDEARIFNPLHRLPGIFLRLATHREPPIPAA